MGKYNKIKWSRIISDTWRWIKEDRKGWIYLIVTSILGFFARFHKGALILSSNLLESVFYATIGPVFVLLIVFIANIIKTPTKIFYEQEESINDLQSKIEELTKEIQLSRIDINFEKYGYPNIINSKAVGITINNLEKYDLTDICLKLIELKKSQFSASSSESIRSILIRIGHNCDFDLNGDFRIRAEEKRDIRLGELRDGELFFLAKDTFNPESWFQEQQPGISMHNAIWELKFELRGKTQGNNFRKEVFYTRIGVVGGIVNIGEISNISINRGKVKEAEAH